MNKNTNFSMAKTNYDLFKIASGSLTDRLREIVEAMPYKGDTSEDSQKIFLMEKLNDFERALNGVEIEDFEEE